MLAAPNLDPDILTYPPRVMPGEDGQPHLETYGNDGWHDNGPVLEIVRLERHGMVLVATDEETFMMTAHDYDQPAGDVPEDVAE